MPKLFYCAYFILVTSSNLSINAELSPFPLRNNNSKTKKQLLLTNQDLNVAVQVAEDIIFKWKRLEENLVGSKIEVQQNSPSHGQLIQSYPLEEALEFGKNALIANRASLYLVQKHCQKSNIYLSDCLETIRQWSLSKTSIGSKCESQFGKDNCTQYEFYRSYNGACNHILNPSWGRSLTPYSRFISPKYANGIDEPRRSVSRKPLPSPRFISNVLIPHFDKSEKLTTLAFVQWTQFVSDDLFHTATNKMIHTGSPIECCHPNGKNLNPRFMHPKCQPIFIPEDDPDYAPQKIICMNYVRSITSLRDECKFGPADQMNQATHFLDGSMIYGSTTSKALSLRAKNKGKLLTIIKNNVELLPISDKHENICQDKEICFTSGDSRVNMHPHHTTMYTIWVREHNRIADILLQLNPHWNDNVVFEETRKIVIAEIQHITYSYWIPYVLGKESTEKNNLSAKLKGFSDFYSEDINPAVSNSFATVGLRFIYSMFQSQIKLYDETGFHKESLPLKDYFNKPSIIERPEWFQGLLRGLSLEASQKMDASFVKDVTNFMFRGSSSMGQDIVSLDIQRGRDHGLPGYNAFRKFCNMSSSDKFETFLDTIPLSIINKLKAVYNHPDDVDLYVGAILEMPQHDSPLGPTFQCIIKEQMLKTRNGDRYFYDIGGKSYSFKEGQINEIKKITLSRVFCENVEGLNKIQVDVFNVPSKKNPLFNCDDSSKVPRLNFNLWQSIS